MGKLGFGCMRLPLLDPDKPESVDREQACRMVDRFLMSGGTYFDTAYMYHHFQSERVVKEILVDRYPRDRFTLADKLPVVSLKCQEDVERIFQEQLEKCGVTYFDYYLLHDLGVSHYEQALKYDCFSFLNRLKEKGLARKIGFSFHDTADVLDRILTDHPEVDFVQLQINYLDWEDAGIQSRLCYETAVRHKKPVVIMEPVKGGSLAQLPEAARQVLGACHPDWSPAAWALRFAAGLDQVMMVLSGMSSLEQMEENLQVLEAPKPLSQAEQEAIRQAVEQIRKTVVIPCTACGYCLDGCPQHIAIPSYFALYNAEKKDPHEKPWAQRAYYANISQTHGKASDCVACGTCENICPQHLPIIQLLQDVAGALED